MSLAGRSARARAPGDPLRTLRREAGACRACPLWEGATQAVVGEGPTSAAMMLVGEQPGDQEDRLGHPFVGPAGKVLDTALERAQLERSKVFITNGVKHFKHRMRGKRRIHQRPSAAEVNACRPWLAAELELLAPAVIVALGATAAYSVLGRTVGIGEHRGRVLESELFARQVVVTAHPSSILRERDAGARRAALAALADDLGVAAQLI